MSIEREMAEILEALASTTRDEESSWKPVDLGPFITAIESGEDLTPPTGVLMRNDGVGLLYAGRVNSIIGKPESSKTWLCMVAARQELGRGGRVAWIDLEDDPRTAITRMIALDTPTDVLRESFVYFQPNVPMCRPEGVIEERFGPFEDWLREWRPTLIVLDSVGFFSALNGLSSNSNDEMSMQGKLIQRMAWAADSTVLIIDHVAKGERSAITEIGSQAKGAVSDGVRYYLKQDPHAILSPGNEGRMTLLVLKDRPGGIRRHSSQSDELQVACDVTLSSNAETGIVSFDLRPPEGAAVHDWRPTWFMEAGSRALEGAGDEGLSLDALRDAMRATTRRSGPEIERKITGAVAELLKGSHAKETRQRGSRWFVHRSRFRQDPTGEPVKLTLVEGEE